MLGSGYLIDHVIAAFEAKQESKIYRIYVTDALKAIAENTTHFLSLEGPVDYGTSLQNRWAEIVEPNHKQEEKEPEDTRSCTEIAAGVFARARIFAPKGDVNERI